MASVQSARLNSRGTLVAIPDCTRSHAGRRSLLRSLVLASSRLARLPGGNRRGRALAMAGRHPFQFSDLQSRCAAFGISAGPAAVLRPPSLRPSAWSSLVSTVMSAIPCMSVSPRAGSAYGSYSAARTPTQSPRSAQLHLACICSWFSTRNLRFSKNSGPITNDIVRTSAAGCRACTAGIHRSWIGFCSDSFHRISLTPSCLPKLAAHTDDQATSSFRST